MKIDYLNSRTDMEIRAALLNGLSRLRQQKPTQLAFEYAKVVGQVARDLFVGAEVTAAAAAWATYQAGYAEDPQGKHEHADNRRLLGALWGLVAEGAIYPRLASYQLDGYPHVIDRVVLTPRGERILDGASGHPLHLGFVARFRARAPSISDEVVSRMEDAVSCAERFLLRAAVVMVGLATEETIRVAHDAMVHQGHIKKGVGLMAKAKNILADIEAASKSWPDKDERHRLNIAILAAESIRTERNNASHPGVVVNDIGAVEELLILAGRQVPVFWEIPIKHAVANGFVVP